MKKNQSKGRLIEDRAASSVAIHQEPPAGDDIGFMPAALCHVFFPYQEPPAGTDFWTRRSGAYILSIAAVPGTDPRTNERINFGVPAGPKPRLILAALNSIALAKQSPELQFGNSLTDFVGKTLQLNTDGRTINKVKAEMTKLARAHVEIAFDNGDGRTFQDGTKIVRGLDLTWSKSGNQFPLWGNHLRFSDDYFNALQAHGLVEAASQKKWGGLTERLLVATASQYVVSPIALGAAGADPGRTADRLSASYLVALAARVIREVGGLVRAARDTGKRLPTLSLDTEICFRSAADRAAFSKELVSAVAALAAKYHDETAPGGRPHRLLVLAHPLPHENPEEARDVYQEKK